LSTPQEADEDWSDPKRSFHVPLVVTVSYRGLSLTLNEHKPSIAGASVEIMRDFPSIMPGIAGSRCRVQRGGHVPAGTGIFNS
jgi:hypothetical protein